MKVSILALNPMCSDMESEKRPFGMKIAEGEISESTLFNLLHIFLQEEEKFNLAPVSGVLVSGRDFAEVYIVTDQDHRGAVGKLERHPRGISVIF
jgi:hypothetical protein